VPTDRGKDVLSRLKTQVSSAQHVYLATDPDREGEAIAWHLVEALKIPKGKYSRVSYHEITETAIKKALAAPHDIDQPMVDAQQARRVLDRIVGYKISPKLWAQVQGLGLSAGRVQTPTLRLVVERDRSIADFKPTHHFGAELDFDPETPFTATWDTTRYRKSEAEPYVLDRPMAEVAACIRKVTVVACTDGQRVMNAPPPFTTSALQQSASAKLDFSPEYTMKLAQALFERHHAISYHHRTDSVTLADEAIATIRDYAKTKQYPLPDRPNKHVAKSKGAQEAHEAIRPTDVTAELPYGVSGDELKLYQLIHRQAVASQLAPAVLSTRKIKLVNGAQDGPNGTAIAASAFSYEARGQSIVKPGFTVLGAAPKETSLPTLGAGQWLNVADARVLEQQTKPPARYTEGSLIADLERRGIGRPSTWAAILKNIKDRGYIKVKGKKVFSTAVGGALVDAVADMRFAQYDYTARLEAALDRIASGEISYTRVVRVGWKHVDDDINERMHPMRVPAGGFSIATAEDKPRSKAPSKRKSPAKPRKATGKTSAKTPKCPDCGGQMKERQSARGSFYGCARYPDCRGTQAA